MKHFKTILTTICIGLMLPVTVTGCVKKDATLSVPIMQETVGANTPTTTDSPQPTQPDTAQTDSSVPEQPDPSQTSPLTSEQSDSGNSIMPAGQEFLSGKVKELNEDGFLFSRTVLTTDSEGNRTSLVTFVDEEDAEKIPVKYTPDTKFEHWTIKDGGAGIDRKDALASDITKGMGLEISGHFEGIEFIAELILIEVYE